MIFFVKYANVGASLTIKLLTRLLDKCFSIRSKPQSKKKGKPARKFARKCCSTPKMSSWIRTPKKNVELRHFLANFRAGFPFFFDCGFDLIEKHLSNNLVKSFIVSEAPTFAYFTKKIIYDISIVHLFISSEKSL